MKLQRIYVDTSVIGGCLDKEFASWSSGLLRDFREGNFRLVLSMLVSAEVADAFEAIQEQYAQFWR